MNDHARPERQRFLREQSEKVLRDAMIYGTGVMQHVPIQQVFKSEVQLTKREFYGWLAMAFCYGAVACFVVVVHFGWRPI